MSHYHPDLFPQCTGRDAISESILQVPICWKSNFIYDPAGMRGLFSTTVREMI